MDQQLILERLQEYKSAENKYPIARLGLFGSFARGENIENSDIDILIEFDTHDIGWEYIDLASDLKQLFTGYKVDVVSRGAIPELYWNEIKNEVLYA